MDSTRRTPFEVFAAGVVLFVVAGLNIAFFIVHKDVSEVGLIALLTAGGYVGGLRAKTRLDQIKAAAEAALQAGSAEMRRPDEPPEGGAG